ncbi:MAG: hypothetical protein AB4050_17250 [Synechococcus sp.]
MADEDIIRYENNSFERFFDGSDVGLSGVEISAFDAINSNEILLSFDKPINLPGLGRVDDSDVVKFIGSSLGNRTSGRFEFYLDGSDVGLGKDGEDIDALALQSDGTLLLSTIGNAYLPGIRQAADEDVIKFTPNSLGRNSRGRWSRYFDGSDVGLANNGGEDIDALTLDTGDRIVLSTQGNFSVRSLSGKDEDAFSFRASSTGSNTSGSFGPGLIFDGSQFSLGNNDISGLDRKIEM